MSQQTFLQVAHGQVANGSSLSATFGSNVTRHSTLVAVVAMSLVGAKIGGIITPALSDTQGNPWQTASPSQNLYNVSQSFVVNGNAAIACLFTPDCAAGSTEVTVELPGNYNAVMSVFEVGPLSGGVLNAIPLIVAAGIGSSTGLFLNGDVLNQFSTYCIAFGYDGGSVNPSTATPASGSPSPTGWYQRDTIANDAIGNLTAFEQNTSGGGVGQTNINVNLGAAALTSNYCGVLIGFYSTGASPAASVPVATPVPNNFIVPQSVSLFQQQGLSMYYTTDGSTPTTGSTLYTAPISVGGTETLKVLAHDSSAYYTDVIGVYVYNITGAPANGTNALCLEITPDTSTLPEPSMNLALQQLDSVMNGAFTYAVLNQVDPQAIDAYAPALSQSMVLALTGSLSEDITIVFDSTEFGPAPNALTPDAEHHPYGWNPLRLPLANRPFVLINNVTMNGHTITLAGTLASDSSPFSYAGPTLVISSTGLTFIYNAGSLGILEIV